MKVKVEKEARRASRNLTTIQMRLEIYRNPSDTEPEIVHRTQRTVRYLDDEDVAAKQEDIRKEFQSVIEKYVAALAKWRNFDQAFEQFCKEIEASLTKYVVCPVAWQIGA